MAQRRATLWTQVTPDEWPAWVRPSGAHDAYNTGDKVTHNGKQYTSQIDGNTTEREQTNAGGAKRKNKF